ncbi:hypothetical protein MKW98_012822 [Papaver atlanticum]|uniref:RING-type E3 ubiquitin transferase n=1 Tax=Papaver atlanticum TaxID=357466 RepID=A0AAD4XGU4_9MAGN|nr:hypothetical protein MKW98_012822 [Papaver atlanticum]
MSMVIYIKNPLSSPPSSCYQAQLSLTKFWRRCLGFSAMEELLESRVMEELESSSNIHSELRQSLLNALERFHIVFGAAPTDQNRRGSERASQLTDEVANTIEGFPRLQELNQSVEALLQSLRSRPLRAPPASKEVVANLPTITVTEETLMKLGIDTECAVCNENLVIDDKMQELPCKHLFHPLCLMPWLDKHNSCPVCRHELPTDNEAYERWKESEKEAEKARRDAANSVC